MRIHKVDGVCYYDSEACNGELWQCETCEEWYCEVHRHETALGRNVECVACERRRKYANPLMVWRRVAA